MPEYTKEEYEWKKDSLCREYPDISFVNLPYSANGHSPILKQMREICGKCVVATECRELIDAIETPPESSRAVLPSYGLNFLAGFWAGESPIERMRRRCREVGYRIPAWLGGESEEDNSAEGI